MSEVWKFPLDYETVLDLPIGSEILCVHEQDYKCNLWVKVDPDAITEQRKFVCYGTGHDIPNKHEMTYIGTVFLFNNTLVLHYFEVPMCFKY